MMGHWEGDSIVSRKSLVALNNLAERTSRLLLLTKIQRKTAENTADTVIRHFKKLPKIMKKTLTLDNGTENALHKMITAKTGVKCYFADLYASLHIREGVMNRLMDL